MIYGFISPSWAARLWYNLRTFPDRVSSRLSQQEFLDYDSYKEWKKLIWLDEDENTSNSSDVEKGESDTDNSDKIDSDLDSKQDSKNDIVDVDSTSSSSNTSSDSQTSNFLNTSDTEKSQEKPTLSGYSKSDLLWVIWNYIQNNLDDNNDILVTIEYSDDNDPEKIILKTYPKSSNNSHSSSDSSKSETSVVVADKKPEPAPTKTSKASSSKSSSNWLSQKDMRDAEELFSVLF